MKEHSTMEGLKYNFNAFPKKSTHPLKLRMNRSPNLIRPWNGFALKQLDKCHQNASCISKETYFFISSSRQISSQERLGSQEAGLGWGLSSPTPPVSRNFHSSTHTSPLLRSKLAQRTNENRSCRVDDKRE